MTDVDSFLLEARETLAKKYEKIAAQQIMNGGHSTASDLQHRARLVRSGQKEAIAVGVIAALLKTAEPVQTPWVELRRFSFSQADHPTLWGSPRVRYQVYFRAGYYGIVLSIFDVSLGSYVHKEQKELSEEQYLRWSENLLYGISKSPGLNPEDELAWINGISETQVLHQSAGEAAWATPTQVL